MERNIKITIEYDGSGYSGWQRQPERKSIQEEIERAIFAITGEEVNINGSGRTDAGVHAIGQTASFNTESKIPTERIAAAINSKLPQDIIIRSSEEVEPEFHARFSAKKKRYRYLIHNSKIGSALIDGRTYNVAYELDFDRMSESLRDILGRHDFGAFVSVNTQVSDFVREIYDARLYRVENPFGQELIALELEGNGFLYNMVRIIAGTLVDIGRGRITASMKDIIESRDRNMAGHTAPAHGLYLLEVSYD